MYYGIKAGSNDTILQKDDSSGNNIWGKNITLAYITGKSLALSDDESSLYYADTKNTNKIEIFRFNANDGNFVKKFERYVIIKMIIL